MTSILVEAVDNPSIFLMKFVKWSFSFERTIMYTHNMIICAPLYPSYSCPATSPVTALSIKSSGRFTSCKLFTICLELNQMVATSRFVEHWWSNASMISFSSRNNNSSLYLSNSLSISGREWLVNLNIGSITSCFFASSIILSISMILSISSLILFLIILSPL